MKVRLLQHTEQPERLIAATAKLCYAASDIDGVFDNLGDGDKVGGFVERLRSMGHDSALEHASFTFGIEGVSRALLAQITRHRIASFSVQSQRYVKEHGFEYVIPPEIDALPEARAEFIAAMEDAQRRYDRLTELLTQAHIGRLESEGLSVKEAAGKAAKAAIEDARFVLPNACDTKMIVTMNARSLKNFFRLRCCMRAQWEIRALADEMLRLVKQVAPVIFRDDGPPCVAGTCSEGAMSCGEAARIREKYRIMQGRLWESL